MCSEVVRSQLFGFLQAQTGSQSFVVWIRVSLDIWL